MYKFFFFTPPITFYSWEKSGKERKKCISNELQSSTKKHVLSVPVQVSFSKWSLFFSQDQSYEHRVRIEPMSNVSQVNWLFYTTQYFPSPVGWGCKIHRGVRLPNECPRYDTKRSDGEAPVMLELWGMRSTPSLPSLPGPLWLGVVAPDRVYGFNRTKLCCLEQNCFWHWNCVLMLNWIVWNGTVFIFKLCTYT